MVDFVAQIPAVTLLWMAIMGMAAARAAVVQPTEGATSQAMQERARA
jgi:hypothetical protein